MLILIPVLLAALPESNAADHSPQNSPVPPHWLVKSENFIVRACRPTNLKPIRDAGEGWRTHLAKKWLGKCEAAWRPRCEIVIHASRASYLAEVGPGGTQTYGSSFIQFSRDGLVSERRIDLLMDRKGKLSALPHELTHIVLADRFGERQTPPWANEGIATLSDSKEKRALHLRDCCDSVDSGTAFRVHELLTLTRLRDPSRTATFYGQSVSLTSFLKQRNGPQAIPHFVERAMRCGYDQSLRECYGIDGIAELERLWRADLAQQRRSAKEELSSVGQVHAVTQRR